MLETPAGTSLLSESSPRGSPAEGAQAFLVHLQLQGTSRAAPRNLSVELIHVVRLLRLQKLRDVRPEEINKAAERFAHQQLSNDLGISALKYALDWNGYYGGPARLPLLPLTAELKAEVEQLMVDLRNELPGVIPISGSNVRCSA